MALYRVVSIIESPTFPEGGNCAMIVFEENATEEEIEDLDIGDAEFGEIVSVEQISD